MIMQKQEQFLALQPGGLEMMKENLGNFQINPWDMDKVSVPLGGGTNWQVPDLENGAKAVKTLVGIVLHWMPYRRYYASGLDDPGGQAGPPDCFSTDDVQGTGDPGGDCESCEMNVWGSGKNGGTACASQRLLFLLQPNAYLPLLIQLPRMSVKPLNQYLSRLASHGAQYSHVVTSFDLEKAQQRTGGIQYSRAVPKMVRFLTDEEIAAVKALTFRPHISARQALAG